MLLKCILIAIHFYMLPELFGWQNLSIFLSKSVLCSGKNFEFKKICNAYTSKFCYKTYLENIDGGSYYFNDT
jgi:hypothetical protein